MKKFSTYATAVVDGLLALAIGLFEGIRYAFYGVGLLVGLQVLQKGLTFKLSLF